MYLFDQIVPRMIAVLVPDKAVVLCLNKFNQVLFVESCAVFYFSIDAADGFLRMC